LRDQNRLRDEAQIGALLSEEVLAILPRLVGHDKPSTKLLTRMFHEWPTATTDMAVLPGVLGCSFDRLPATGLPETISGQAGQAGQAHPATYRSGTRRI